MARRPLAPQRPAPAAPAYARPNGSCSRRDGQLPAQLNHAAEVVEALVVSNNGAVGLRQVRAPPRLPCLLWPSSSRSTRAALLLPPLPLSPRQPADLHLPVRGAHAGSRCSSASWRPRTRVARAAEAHPSTSHPGGSPMRRARPLGLDLAHERHARTLLRALSQRCACPERRSREIAIS